MNLSLVGLYFLLAPCFTINEQHMKWVAHTLSDRLHSMLESSSHHEALTKKYEHLYKTGVLEKTLTDPAEVSSLFSKRLQDALFEKTESLRRIKNYGEALYNSHRPVRNKTACKGKASADNYTVAEYVPFFYDLKVSINQSLAQVPRNIYKCDASILNVEQWSAGLDDAFLENFQQSPDLLWQYFGSVTGLFRSFPGADKENIDLTYDPRRRLWYSQAINSAKDVVLAIDLTGSIVGTPFKIVKLVTKSLIETFQQNDFFNVIYLRDNEASILDICEEKLIQATNSNKDVIKNYIDKLPSPYGEGELDKLVQSSLDLLNVSYHDDFASSMCNKIIMIVSDGLEFRSDMHELMEKYKHLNVVIFYYYIGYGNSNEKVGGCAFFNGRQLYKFPTLGSVPIGVLEYQSVLNQPFLNDVTHNDGLEFTPLYKDFFKLGLMVTIAAGLYGDDSGKKVLLGVAGIDVKITILEQQYPKEKLGIFGHAFVLNNNGLVLIHPKLAGIAESYQDPSSVFLEDAEHSDDVEDIKILMIDREETCKTSNIHHYFPIGSKRRHYVTKSTYCIKPINGTPYTSAVSMPDNNKYRLTARNMSKHLYNEGLKALIYRNQSKVMIANWLFCDFKSRYQQYQPSSILAYPTAEEVYDFLNTDSSNILKCDETMLNNLLVSAAVLTEHKKNYKSILRTYFITVDGVVVFNNDSDITFDRHILQNDILLQTSAFEEEDSILITVPIVDTYRRPLRYENNDQNIIFKISKPIYVADTFLGVSGVELAEKNFSEIIRNVLNNSSCDTCESFLCENIDNYLCFILDENAYVVYSNQGNHLVGSYFGLISGKLLSALVKSKVYYSHTLTETKHKCERVAPFDAESDARSLFSTYFVYSLTHYLKFLIAQILAFSSQAFTSHEANATRYEYKCSKEFNILKRNKSIEQTTGDIKCSESCVNNFSMFSVNKTNLDFIVLANDCDLSCVSMMSSNEPVKTEDQNCTSTRKYRRARDTCFQKFPGAFESSSEIVFNMKTYMCNCLLPLFGILNILYI